MHVLLTCWQCFNVSNLSRAAVHSVLARSALRSKRTLTATQTHGNSWYNATFRRSGTLHKRGGVIHLQQVVRTGCNAVGN